MRTIPLSSFQFFFILFFGIISSGLMLYIYLYPYWQFLILDVVGGIGMFITLGVKLVIELEKRVQFK